MIICPCTDCCNIYCHLSNVVVDHLVRRGMDKSYMMRSDWYHHGELKIWAESESKSSQCNEEMFRLYQAAEQLDTKFDRNSDMCESAEGDDKKEDEFLAKLADPDDIVNESRLGPMDVKVLVEIAIVPEALLWRPAAKMSVINEAVGHMIAWPTSKCVNLKQPDTPLMMLLLLKDVGRQKNKMRWLMDFLLDLRQ